MDSSHFHSLRLWPPFSALLTLLLWTFWFTTLVWQWFQRKIYNFHTSAFSLINKLSWNKTQKCGIRVGSAGFFSSVWLLLPEWFLCDFEKQIRCLFEILFSQRPHICIKYKFDVMHFSRWFCFSNDGIKIRLLSAYKWVRKRIVCWWCFFFSLLQMYEIIASYEKNNINIKCSKHYLKMYMNIRNCICFGLACAKIMAQREKEQKKKCGKDSTRKLDAIISFHFLQPNKKNFSEFLLACECVWQCLCCPPFFFHYVFRSHFTHFWQNVKSNKQAFKKKTRKIFTGARLHVFLTIWRLKCKQTQDK